MPVAVVDAHTAAVRAQRRDRLELAVPQVGGEQGLQRRGRPCRTSRRLELGAGRPVAGARKLQLPERLPVLEAAAERDPGARKGSGPACRG